MLYENLSTKIIALKNADIALREKLVQNGKLFDGYHESMKALHNKNAKALAVIIEKIGYPTVDKVGKEANEAAWLIIQHAIEQPKFMKKCAQLLEIAVNENNASPINLAYLIDRIAVFEDRPQLYGTQFDWDENGELSPNLFYHWDKVNERRISIGLNTLEEQTEIIRQNAKKENQFPPFDFEKRKEEIDEWKKRVGWKK
ncbi:DUF6624 domain-containing protein [Flavobacterium sp. J27]|uniref:DUF6624 domain-containing protein n=1 Tax=Flavobacterium sp. J27 TaxID=2060419 RepID=UPI0010316417|nr:DUF6624 domain-containing protein [Flavobacterium sp. J27]